MKLRSYLRGIGVGILVASAVFLVSEMGEGNGTMTDAQIIARAKELGMVEGPTTVADYGDGVIVTPDIEYIDENKDEDPQQDLEVSDDIKEENVAEVDLSDEPENTPLVTEEPKPTPTSVPTPEPTKEIEEEKVIPTPVPTKAVTEEEKITPTVAPVENASDIVIIVVNPGDGSDRVAQRLYEQGLVDNAHEFDVFLMENGYDRKITTGNHKISKSATKDEIGKNLVSSTK